MDSAALTTYKSRSARNNTVELLRVVFSFAVVICHSTFLPWSEGHLPIKSGSLAVEFFFIVSGYFMAVSAWRKKDIPSSSLGTDTWQFIWKKLKGHISYLLLCVDTFDHNTLYHSCYINGRIEC